MSAVGFDIGSENSYIAAVKAGGIEILDNEYSLRSTPTYIGFTEKCRDIGITAKSKIITNLENTVFGFKRILGKTLDDEEIQDEMTYLPLQVCDLSGKIGIKVKYLSNTIVFSIEQLMAMILTKLKVITESKLGNIIRDCVIAVPAYYTDAQRRAMLDAVNIAELNAVKLINESTAVALSYGFFKQDLFDHEFQNVVFIDLGKSCLTTTVCVFTKDKVRILGCVWDHVGGRDFDNKLVQYFIEDFKNRYNIDAMTNKKALMTLIHECEQLKKIMSANSNEVRLQIECFMNDYDVTGKMKKEIFEKLCEQVLKKIEMNFHRILRKTELKPGDIHSVEVIGGSSRIPAVKELVKKTFGRKPNETLNQDEAVARGCALQFAMLSPSLKTRNYILDDIPSYIIKISWKSKESQEEILELFNFSDKLPSSKLVTIYVSKPFFIQACYCDSTQKLSQIGTFALENIPEDIEKSGLMRVKIKACLNIHGIFNIKSAKLIQKNEETEQCDKIVPAIHETNVDIQLTDVEKISSPEHLAQNVRMSCAVKSYELTVKPDVSGLTELGLNEFIHAEQNMNCKDIEEKEKADARNFLEEFIYEVKGKLNSELGEFVLENDKITLLQKLDVAGKWLEENENLETSEYSKKLKDLKKLFDPISRRYTEWQERQRIIDDYREVLQQGFNAVIEENSINTYTEETIQSLLSFLIERKENLDGYVEKISQLGKVDDVPITVCELQSSLLSFKTSFQNLIMEKQRKQNATQKIPDPCCGEGINENPVSSNPNNLSKES